jgi:hypothetical protein
MYSATLLVATYARELSVKAMKTKSSSYTIWEVKLCTTKHERGDITYYVLRQ